jgi:hypothetical protein
MKGLRVGPSRGDVAGATRTNRHGAQKTCAHYHIGIDAHKRFSEVYVLADAEPFHTY